MKLYILEGPHAVGKSTMLNKVRDDIVVMDEEYFDLDRFICDSMFHQYDWLLHWVHRVLKHKKNGVDVIISDRGPVTSLIYGGNGFKHLVDEIFEKLEENQIETINLILSCPETNDHIKRIKNRNGPLAEVELQNLEIIKDKYNKMCEDYTTVKDLEHLKSVLGI